MTGAKKSTWIGGTVFVALVIAAAAWFLAISPTLAAASDLRDQTEQTKQQNDLLQMRVAKLAADFKKLPEYKAQLETLRAQIPVDAKLADYLRQLDAVATAHAVVITAVNPSVPVSVVLDPGTAAAAPTPAEGSTEASTTETGGTEGETAAGDGTAAAPAGPSVPAGFTAIPVALTVLGSYDNVIAFLDDVQHATPRLFLVTALTGTAQDDADGSGGKPATKVGDLELVITGQAYVLPDTLTPAAPADPAAPAPALPGAVPGKNPLVPIQGR